jgi:hypothetical protein
MIIMVSPWIYHIWLQFLYKNEFYYGYLLIILSTEVIWLIICWQSVQNINWIYFLIIRILSNLKNPTVTILYETILLLIYIRRVFLLFMILNYVDDDIFKFYDHFYHFYLAFYHFEHVDYFLCNRILWFFIFSYYYYKVMELLE